MITKTKFNISPTSYPDNETGLPNEEIHFIAW